MRILPVTNSQSQALSALSSFLKVPQKRLSEFIVSAQAFYIQNS